MIDGNRAAYVSVVEGIPPNLAVAVDGSSAVHVDVVSRQEPEGGSESFG